MKLIVGLGNPGSQYERTRHNVGFMCLDLFAQKHGAANFRVAHEAFVGEVNVSGEKLILLKPQTYMNLSGRSVASAMQFYRLGLDDLLVVVDDVALPCGIIRLRPAGSAGGHNGLKDIQRALGGLALLAGKTGQDYARLRIGLDPPPPPPAQVPQKEYVLSAFTAAQKPKLDSALKNAVQAIAVWAQRGIVAAMNQFNAGEKP